MRVCVLLLGLCAACATTVSEYPMETDPDPTHALIAGSTDFDLVHVHQQGTDEEFNIRPSHNEFLVSLPPGTYVLMGFDGYEPTDDRVTFEARAGEAIYVGSFLRDRDTNNRLMVTVANLKPDVESALVKRYGVNVPELALELVRSTLAPTDDEFGIAVHRDRSPNYWAYGITWGIFWPFYHHGHHHGHGHRSRRAGRRRR